MAEVGSGFDLTLPKRLDDMATAVEQMGAAMPKPATAAPPAVQVDSNKGMAPRYALEDHTHESRLQARRISLTLDTNGRAVYVFPKAYESGLVPIVQVTAETPTGVAYRNDAAILQGSTTNAQTTIVVTRLNQNVVTGLLNAVLPVFAPATGSVWVNILSRAPS